MRGELCILSRSSFVLDSVVTLCSWRLSVTTNKIRTLQVVPAACILFHDVVVRPAGVVDLLPDLTLGSCFLVLGPWFSALGSWLLAPGSLLAASGCWLLALASCLSAVGAWLMVLAAWFLSLGSWLQAPRHHKSKRSQRPLIYADLPVGGTSNLILTI